jgi:hypothetical protein
MWVDGAFAAGRLAGERFPIGFRYTSIAKLDLTSVDSILNSANRGWVRIAAAGRVGIQAPLDAPHAMCGHTYVVPVPARFLLTL